MSEGQAMIRYLTFYTMLLCGAANAQVAPTCLPNIADAASATASRPHFGASKNGAWVTWDCYGATGTVRMTYIGTLPEIAKVGGRVATIIKAPDPLRSLQTAGQRFAILPLTDPSLAAVLADMNASKR